MYRVNIGTEPNSFDPGQQSYTYEANVGRNVFNALLRPKTDLSDVSGLTADKWSTSSDGLTWTFHIRDNAKWSDGQPVKAQDFVYGWKRLLNPALAAPYVDPFFDQTIAGAQNYANVSTTDAGAITTFLNGLGLSAPDDHTFQVKLQSPAPYFKWIATLWVGAPIRQDVVEKAAGGPVGAADATAAEKWAQTPTSIVGNGPFMISEEVPKDHVTMVPNPNFWHKVTLQKLTFTFIEDANTMFAKYQTNELDQINVPVADTKTVSGQSYSNQLLKINTLGPWWMSYNTKVAPLDNPKVRLALSKAIDREKLCKDVEQGQCSPLQELLPKGFPGYDSSIGNPQNFDPAGAKKLLQEAGVTPDQLSNLKLLTRNTTRNVTNNTYIADQWNKNLGTNIKLETIDSKTVTQHIRKGQFDIYGPDGWGFDYPDAQDILGNYLTGTCHSLNWGCWSNSDYDSTVKDYNSSTDNSKKQSLLKHALNILDTEAPLGFIYQSTEWDLVKPYVHLNYSIEDDEYTPGDFYYDYAYIVSH